MGQPRNTLGVFPNACCTLCGRIFPAWKLTFSRGIFFFTSRFRQLPAVKLRRREGLGGTHSALPASKDGRATSHEKIFLAWKLTFSREIFLITSGFHHLQAVKLGGGRAWERLKVPYEYSWTSWRSYMRKYFLHEIHHFLAKYFSSSRAIPGPSSRLRRQNAMKLVTIQLILHYLLGKTLNGKNKYTQKNIKPENFSEVTSGPQTRRRR